MKLQRKETHLMPPEEVHAPGETAGQDVNDQTWEPVLPDASMSFGHDGHKTEGIRTIGNVLDILHDVVEEVFDGREHGEDRSDKYFGHRPHVIDVQSHSARSWRANQYAVTPGGLRVVVERDDRMLTTLTNQGPDPIYLSHDSQAATGSDITASPGVVRLAINTSRVFRTGGEVWAYVAAGKAAVIDVQDEYGYAGTSTR